MGFKNFVKKIKHFNSLELPTQKGVSNHAYGTVQHLNSLNLPASSYIMGGMPTYRNLSTQAYLLDCYEQNPIVQAVINIKANAWANMRFYVRDLKTDEKVPLSEYDKDGGKLRELLESPNPLQSTYEWLRQFKINFEVFGNGYMYGFVPVGFENIRFNYQDINTINNLHSNCVRPVLTGNWLTATTKEEIIEKYLFDTINSKTKTLPTRTVFHLNNANIRLDQNFTEGVSDLISLRDPISNIDVAFESRNVMGRNRGAEGILTSDKKDEAVGTVPMTDGEIDKVQESMKKYGSLDHQYRHIVTPMPLKFQRMAIPVKDLMLLEEVSHSAIAICNAKGVPEGLMRNYIRTGTLGTDNDTEEKRFYDSTIIPESFEFLTLFNSFLKTQDTGIELLGSFDHLKCLQTDRKKEAEVKKITIEGAERAFRMGTVPYRYVMNCLDVEIDEGLADKYIWDLEQDQRNAIGINNKVVANGEEQE